MYERRYGYLVPALVLSVCAAGVFGAAAWGYKQNIVTPYDEEAAQTLADHRRANPELEKFMGKVSNVGTPETLVVVAFVTTLALLRLRQLWLLVIWVLLILGGDYLNKEIKGVFERPRPTVVDVKPKAGKPPSWSFPSGHAMDSTIGYGMLVYVLLLAAPRPWIRIGFVLLLIVLIDFSRVYLNAHYPSDVVGGSGSGLACVGVGVGACEVLRSRQGRFSGAAA